MKATDLRIGNLLAYFGKVSKVVGIEVDTIDGTYFIRTENSLENILAFSGIPLTEEWLIKFGFDKGYPEYNHRHYLKNGVKILTYESDDVGYYWLGRYGSNPYPKIQYVHQLQSLYFALTGEELAIKIKQEA